MILLKLNCPSFFFFLAEIHLKEESEDFSSLFEKFLLISSINTYKPTFSYIFQTIAVKL